MRSFIERIRGNDQHTFKRGNVTVIKEIQEIQVVKHHHEERSLILKCKSGRNSVCFNEFLPDRWEIRELDEELSVRMVAWEDHGRKAIFVPDLIAIDDLDETPFLPSDSSLRKRSFRAEPAHVFFLMRGAFFGLLHELRHVLEFEEKSGEQRRKELRLVRLTEDTPPIQITRKDREKYLSIIVGGERRVSEGTLEMLQAFRADGLDLEPEMSDDELFQFAEDMIAGHLRKYKKMVEMR